MPRAEHSPLVVQFAGASTGSHAEPVSSSGAYANYLIGNDPSKWRTRVPLAERVRTRGLYPGVDLDFYGTQGKLEYDLTVGPGADPGQIQLEASSLGPAHVDDAGELVFAGSAEHFVMHAPVAYQAAANGTHEPVRAAYRLTPNAAAGNTVGFELGAYDHTRPLVIDPTVVVVYASYFGGSGDQYAGGIAVDAGGNMYLTGTTNSTDFPTANPEQTTGSIFVSKLNAAGTALVYSTYLGGTSGNDAPGGASVGIDTGHALAVDSTGTVYLVGTTASLDFPVTSSAYQLTSGSNDPRSGFLVRLSADGTKLLYASFFGDALTPTSVAADNSGHAYMIGSGQVPDVPETSNAYYIPDPNNYKDYVAILAFVAEFDTTKSGAASLPYSTVFGHIGTAGVDIALDSAGNLDLLGATNSAFGLGYGTIDIAGSAYESAPFNEGTAWVAKLSLVQSVPTALVASTYIGGAAPAGVTGTVEAPTSLAVDGSNNVYVTGTTLSNSFPTYRAINPNRLTSPNGFLTAFTSNLQYVVYSTYIGDESSFGPTSLAVASNGDAVLTGFAGPGLVVVNGIPSVTPPVNNGGNTTYDAVLLGVPSGGGSELYATYLGTGGAIHGFLALDSSENAYLFADDGTVTPTPGAFQSTVTGGDTPFLMKLSFTTTTIASIVRVVPASGANTGVTTVTVHGTGFQTGATLTLNCAGQSYSGLIFSATDSLLSAYVDLRGAAVGACDVVVATSSQGTATAASGFGIDGVASPQVFTQVVGPSMIREGTGQVYTIAYGNTGNTDVYSVPLYITFPEFISYSLLTPVESPTTVPGGNPVDYTQWPLDFNDGNGNTVVALILPIVRAGSNNILEIRLTAANQAQYNDYFFNVNVETEAPWEALTTSPDASPGLRQVFAGGTGQAGPAALTSFTPGSTLPLPQATGPHGLVPTAAGRNALQTAQRRSRVPGAQRSPRPMDIPASDLQFFKDLLTTPAGKACISDIVDFTFKGLSVVPGVGCGIDLALGLVSGELSNAIQGNAATHDADPNVTGVNPYVVGPLVSALGCFPPTVPLKAIIDAANAASAGAKAAVDCGKAYLNPSNGGPRVQIRGPGDPNFKAGPIGAGTQQYITPAQMLNYSVNFANEPTAGAAAQNVTATDTVDTTKVDLTSFAFGPVVIGNHSFVPALSATSISTQIDLRPDVPIIASVNATINPSTGVVTWQFGSLDPATGQPISSSSLSGFLPPDTTMPDGEVALTFSAGLKQGLLTGTTISNTASIVFDGQPAMVTNTWTNTIDADAPKSEVAGLVASTPATATNVAWSGMDAGSGIASYSIYVSEDGGAFTPWLTNTASTSAIFTGQAGHLYGFFSVSADAAGNLEPVKTSADASTTLNLAASTTTLKSVAGPVPVNSPVTLSAVVVGTPNTAGVATGTATFYDGSSFLGTVTLDGTATATLNVAGFASASHSITVLYSGDANYSTSTSSPVSLTVVSLPAPTISFSVPNHTFGDAPFVLSATSSSNGALSYSVLSGPASLSGTTLTLTGAGTVVVQASQSATAAYAAGMQTASFPVAAGLPSITWAPSTHTLNTGIPLGAGVLDATASTPGSFDYTATLSGGTAVAVSALTALSAGSYTLTATFTPTDATNYAVATATQSFTVATQHIWIVNSTGSLSSLDDAGNLLREAPAAGGGVGAAIDNAGNIWSINTGGNSLSEFSNLGSVLNGGLSGGGLNAATALAIDGSGTVWVANGNNSVSTFSNSGPPLTPATGFTGGRLSSPDGVAIDLSGNVWISNAGNNSVTKVLGGAAPVAPLATGVTNNTLGAKP